MRRPLKFFFYFLLLCLGILLTLGVVIQFSDLPSYEPEKVQLKIQSNPEMIAEGARLSSMLCNNCHSGPDNILSGRLLSEAPPEFGTIYSANITADKEHGIGAWTDAEIACFLRTGVKRDGSFVPFYMPRFLHLSDRDLHSIIAYLRSGRSELKAVSRSQPPSRPSFLVKFLCRVAWKPFPYPAQPIESPDSANQVAFGKYLVTGRYDCYPCHSEDFTKVDFSVPENTAGFMAGGIKLSDLSGKTIRSSNLTPDDETGIGTWDFSRFRDALVYGKLTDGGVIRYPMMPYTALRESETRAIYAYLQQIPPIKNKVERGVPE
jgi:hypothetical protein